MSLKQRLYCVFNINIIKHRELFSFNQNLPCKYWIICIFNYISFPFFSRPGQAIFQILTDLTLLELGLWTGYQCCQPWDFIPRSWDFLKWLGFFWDFYFSNWTLGFFLGFFLSKSYWKTDLLISKLAWISRRNTCHSLQFNLGMCWINILALYLVHGSTLFMQYKLPNQPN